LDFPPDDDLVKTKLITIDGFWQYQTFAMGLSYTQASYIGAERPRSRLKTKPERAVTKEI